MRVFSLCTAVFVCVLFLGGCEKQTTPVYDAFSCVLSDESYTLRYEQTDAGVSMTVLAPESIAGLTLCWRGADCRLLYDADGVSLSLPVTEAVTGGFASLPACFWQNARTDKNGIPTETAIRHPNQPTQTRFVVTEFTPVQPSE